MRFELIGKTKAKLVSVDVQALKMGQTELKPAISLRFKITAANTILNKFDQSLRPFLYEKKGTAPKTQGDLAGVTPVSDLPQLTEAAKKIGAFGWADEQTGCKLVMYQGVSGQGDIKLKDGTVDKVKIDPHDGGTTDVFFDYYAADLDAETMGEIAVLHQHELDIELLAPEIISAQKSLPSGDSAAPQTPEKALADQVKKDEKAAGKGPAKAPAAANKPQVKRRA